MPYIKTEDRIRYIGTLNEIPPIKTKGELEYCIFNLMLNYMNGKEWKYSTLHDCTYAAQHCSDEFRRRYLDKREDEAREENGDIGQFLIEDDSKADSSPDHVMEEYNPQWTEEEQIAAMYEFYQAKHMNDTK